MKKKILAIICVAFLLASALAGCGGTTDTPTGDGGASPSGDGGASPSGDIKIALITMDQIDQHWVTLNEGAQKAARELGVTVTFMAPNAKDDAQQIEQVNNAVAGKFDAILVAANGPDAITGALREAQNAGIKIIYVDSPANLPAEATFSTDNKAAGKTAGEQMREALEAAGVTSGDIGVISVNAATDSTVQREAGFREAFAGSGFNIPETQYCDGDAARAQTFAENYITQGVVGIFGANEGSTVGAGNAIKAAGNNAIVGVGFDKSDVIMNLIEDGWLLCTMAQNPDVMGYEGVKAAVEAVGGKSLGGKVVDTRVTVLRASGGGGGGAAAAGPVKIALITMDQIDQHWVTLNEGAQKAAGELGVTVTFMAPNVKDDAQQIEQVNNAVAGKYDAILVAANGPDAITGALREAQNAGIKIIYVDSPANFPAEATFSTDNKAAGKTAGEQMRAALEGAGTTSGNIGVISVNAATDSTVQREAGFREAFAGSGFTILETQYCDGDAARAQTIAENYITQGVVGIFGANEGSTVGAGNAIKAAGNKAIVGVGFDKSDVIMNLIDDGWLLCTMAQNPDVMGYEGVKAAVAAVGGESLGGAVIDTSVSVLKK